MAADGTVYTWGQNDYGQLGNGTSSNNPSPTPAAVSQGTMPVGKRLVQLAGSNFHSLALAAAGKLYTWGDNPYGQLGNNTTTRRNVPTAEVSGFTQWRNVATGSRADHSLVLGAEAAIFTAGLNASGQLGDGTTNSLIFLRNLAPLPVQLVQFAATPQGRTAVRLTWATASETNSARFEVERSPDGVAFAKVGEVAAAGSSLSRRTYALTDATLPTGASVLYYRLRQVDQDGTAATSAVRVVALADGGGLALFPNPAHSLITLRGAAPGAAVQVLDALGRVAATADAEGAAPLPAGLAPGVYLVRAGAVATRLMVQ